LLKGCHGNKIDKLQLFFGQTFLNEKI
jgi:hypothetical protein